MSQNGEHDRENAEHRIRPAALDGLRIQLEADLQSTLRLLTLFFYLHTAHTSPLSPTKMSNVARRTFMKNWYAVEVRGISFVTLVSAWFDLRP